MILFDYIKFWCKALNSRGHGTHSPFVYDFIINVLNDNRAFYCFNQLELNRRKVADKKILNSKKNDQLLFKMVDYYRCNNILSINSNPITTAYLANANATAKIETAINTSSNNKYDFILLDKLNEANEIHFLLNKISTKSFIVVNNIDKNKLQKTVWETLKKANKINASISLYKIGIAVTNDEILVKQHFDIRF